ncbi:MAG: XRE family transcriptional regulator, partial [Ketobacteraceae bacterium]|nr:XRE family transcriptional regulator [Ketobacteraceae bacterium]
FTLELIRAYQPELWETLERWGIGHWPSQYRRERSFLNIYRQNDAARKLTAEQFEGAARLTQAAFDMAVDWYISEESKN